MLRFEFLSVVRGLNEKIRESHVGMELFKEEIGIELGFE